VKDIPRLLPLWLLILLILIIVMQCGCRGGRSLGKGSAGTVIVPQTPQEINERNTVPMPPFEPLPPTLIVPPKSNPIVITNTARSTPVLPEPKSAEANPIIVNPKPAGEELKSFTPTINKNAPPVKLTIENPKEKVNVIKLPPDNGGKGTQVTESSETAPPTKESFSWVELAYQYLLFALIVLLIWTIYDSIKKWGNSKTNRLTNTKLKKSPTKRKRKPITKKKK